MMDDIRPCDAMGRHRAEGDNCRLGGGRVSLACFAGSLEPRPTNRRIHAPSQSPLYSLASSEESKPIGREGSPRPLCFFFTTVAEVYGPGNVCKEAIEAREPPPRGRTSGGHSARWHAVANVLPGPHNQRDRTDRLRSGSQSLSRKRNWSVVGWVKPTERALIRWVSPTHPFWSHVIRSESLLAQRT